MTYERRASPLHAARASVAALWSLLLVTAALAFEHPLVLASVLAVAVGGALAAGVGRRVLLVLRFALPFGVLIAVVNVFVVREGLTVIFRLGEVPPFGQLDLTLESLVYGGVLGFRAVVILLAAAVLTATVDPDEILRVFRRVSFRSALTAALAVRLVPVLQRDARRLGEARRLRADEPPRIAVLRAVAAGSLDRAADVAATLEVRGYRTAAPAGAQRAARVPWSRHDLAFAASTIVIAGLVVVGQFAGVAPFVNEPLVSAPVGTAEVLLCATLLVAGLAPFADRKGIER